MSQTAQTPSCHSSIIRAANGIVSKELFMMKPGDQDQVEGKLHDVKGKVKEVTGKLMNDPDMEADGEAEEIAGKIQNKIGQVKKVFGE
jgi:uncharacterized protein YjbJ (UPF0337 family)